MKKKNIAVLFGSKSPEHEVSLVSFFQALDWLDHQENNFYLIYLDSENQAYLAPWPQKENLSLYIEKVLNSGRKVNFTKGGIVKKGILQRKIDLDAALLVMHGGYGESGIVQGMLDFYEIPYTGSPILGSISGMDKVVTKRILESVGMEMLPYLWFFHDEFKTNSDEWVEKIEERLNYPIFVKPARAGSSVGISKVKNKKELNKAVAKAAEFDFKILVEQGVEQAMDINCAVMGGFDPIASVCEQPISEEGYLSFYEKYLKGGKTKGMAGLSRIVPAPIPDKISDKIQELSKEIFRELGCWGMARIDFLYQKKTNEIYPNEINTIPGSLAYYLWEASGVQPKEMIDRMIKLALERKEIMDKLCYLYQSDILDKS